MLVGTRAGQTAAPRQGRAALPAATPLPPRGTGGKFQAAPASAPQAAAPAMQRLAAALGRRTGPATPKRGDSSLAGYVNPLRQVRGLRPERVDQGVDYQGQGILDAIAAGRIANIAGTGGGAVWPGPGNTYGSDVVETIANGPYAGKDWYAAENVVPLVRPGQAVKAGQPIARLGNQQPGLEMGWAAPRGNRTLAMALDRRGGVQWPRNADAGHWSSATGSSANQLLIALGAPSGILQGPSHGEMPAGYPAPVMPLASSRLAQRLSRRPF